ncbi:MAG: hypothetical protein ACKOD2_02165, partial [Ilumatobacteraceae bacterium]
ATPTKVFTVKATVKGASGQTLVLMAKSGRVLASSKIIGASKAVTLKTPKIKALSGASLHLEGAGGDYYGPVVLSWTGAKSATATRVSTTMTSASTTASLGVITVKAKTANQGAGVVAKKFATSAAPTTRAVNGVPAGVGNYGKNTVSGVSARGVRALGVNYSAGNVAPGADADFDGIANAFDVNDDGDAKLDFQDTDNKPQPSSVGDDCAAKSEFRLFTNFKATQPDFSGTINAYGSGSHEATAANISDALNGTLSFALQRISGQICGESIVKNEFKGINVPYAPSDWVTMPTGGSDVQWTVGNGQMNNQSVAGLSSYTFVCTDLGCPISGQDTFVQRVTTDTGKTFEIIANPGFVFMTHPMLAKIGDTAVDYSATPRGSQSLPASVTSGTDLVFEVYRPQRLAIEGETGTVLDIGGLEYYPDIPNGSYATGGGGAGGGPSSGPGRCDSVKVVDSSFTDTPIDKVSKPTFEITWSIDAIKACFTAKGQSWPSNSDLAIDIQVVAPVQNSGNAAQKIYLGLDVT